MDHVVLAIGLIAGVALTAILAYAVLYVGIVRLGSVWSRLKWFEQLFLVAGAAVLAYVLVNGGW